VILISEWGRARAESALKEVVSLRCSSVLFQIFALCFKHYQKWGSLLMKPGPCMGSTCHGSNSSFTVKSPTDLAQSFNSFLARWDQKQYRFLGEGNERFWWNMLSDKGRVSQHELYGSSYVKGDSSFPHYPIEILHLLCKRPRKSWFQSVTDMNRHWFMCI
jgi:hypothetical protein